MQNICSQVRPGLLRFFLAMVVVLHHSFPIRLGAWAVGMFFVLSGYWIARMWVEKYSLLPSPYGSFVTSRWWRLAPLFLTVQLLAVVLMYLGLPMGGREAISNLGWWVTQPLVIGSTQFSRLLPPSWSLDLEMQFYLIAPLMVIGLGALSGRARLGPVLGMFGWGILLMASGISLETPRLDLYAWLFGVGILASLSRWDPPANLQTGCAAVLILGVLVTMAIPASRELVWRSGNQINRLSPFWGHAFFIAIVSTGIPVALGSVFRKSGKIDRWLGDLSYPLYLFHWIPREWYYSQVDWTQSGWRNGILLVTNIGVAVLGAVILLHVVDRPAQRLKERFLNR